MNFEDALKNHILILDGAMGTMVQALDVTDATFGGSLFRMLTDFLFWGSLALALVLAGVAAFPVVRWLIARGRGHAVVHKYHDHDNGQHSAHH